MGLTAFSFILLPLCLVWLFQPVRLLQTVIVAGIFEAAAALTVGNLGVQPGLVPAIAFIGYVVLQILLGASYPGQAQASRLMLPFILVIAWALLGAFLLPRVFEDQVYVWPQKVDPLGGRVPLAPSSSNVNQVCYLVLNTAFLITASIFVTASRVPVKSLINFYCVSVVAGLGVAIWQFGNRVAGLPYPDSFFYSNPGWAILTDQNIGVVPRINGSFSEPSALGGYMAAAVCATGWMAVQGHRQVVIRVLFVAALFGVLISTSTTGFAALVVAAAGMVAYALVSGKGRMIAAVARIAALLVVLAGVLGLGANAFAPRLITSMEAVYDSVVTKEDSASYQDRTSADVDSLELVLDTYGLGTGWGSNRSSSLIPGLLGSVGVPGMLGLIWFGAALTRRVKWARRNGGNPDELMAIDGCCGAVVGYLIAGVISAPTITSVAFYFLLAVLIGCVARIEVESEVRLRHRGSVIARARATVPRYPVRAAVSTPAEPDEVLTSAGPPRR